MNTGRRYYYLTIAEQKNLTRAAEQLMVSQPSLTQYLNKLEQDLGVILMDRHFSPMRITDAGRVYYDYLKDQYEREQKLLRELDAYRPHHQSVLKVGVPLQKGMTLTRAVLPRFIRDNPGIELSIWEGTAQTVRDRIAKGELEIGFGYSCGEEDEQCVEQPLGLEQVYLVCHKLSPILNGAETSAEHPASVEPEVLKDQIFYQMAPEYVLHKLEQNHLQLHRADPVRRITMSNLYGILNSLAAGPDSGFAYIPDYIFEEKNAQDILPNLGFFCLGDEGPRWEFAMLRRKGRSLSREGKVFWNCVLEEYRAAQ